MDDLTLTLTHLADRIGTLHKRTTRAAAQQINAWRSIRNWCIGWYIAELSNTSKSARTAPSTQRGSSINWWND